MKRVLTIAILAVACAVIAYAGATAQQTGARSVTCHATYPPVSIKAPSSVKHGQTVNVTVSLAKSLGHGLSLTMQYRPPGSSKWRAYGISAHMAKTPYTIKWKAPKSAGKYKLRVKAEYADETGSGTTYSGVRSITVN